MAATSSTAVPGPESASGGLAVLAKTRVRASSPLRWPRVGVELPISLDCIGETGCVYDNSQQADLDYLRARYYDPSTAQFLTADPLASRTKERYGYVNDNPLNGTDPSGLIGCGIFQFACDTAGNVAGGVGHAASAVGNGLTDAGQWLNNNSGTIMHVGTVLAVVGVACGLGVVTAEASCAVAGAGAIAAGAIGTGVDAAKAVSGNGSWATVGVDVFGDVSGVEGMLAEAGTWSAAWWALSGAVDARASEQMYWQADAASIWSGCAANSGY